MGRLTRACRVPQDNNGCTALDLAIKKEQKQVTTFLQTSKADSTFAWKQMLSITQWKQWFVGGGSVEVCSMTCDES